MRRLLSGLFVCASLCFSFYIVGQTNDTPKLDEAIHQLEVQQMRAQDAVARAKQIADPAKKRNAEELYEDARIQYNAFIDDIARHIQYKTKANPLRHATDAHDAADKFASYIDENAPPSLGVMTAILPIVETLLKEATGIGGSARASSGSDQDRKDLANEVRKYDWPAW